MRKFLFLFLFFPILNLQAQNVTIKVLEPGEPCELNHDTMKKLTIRFYLIILTLFPSMLSAQIQVPDPIFRQVIGYHGIKCDSMGFIINSEDAAEIKRLELQDLSQFKIDAIADLSGIEAFTSLEFLDCTGLRRLSKLDLSSNLRLEKLVCDFCPIASLNLQYNLALEEFSCYNCNLTSLDVSNNKNLQWLVLNSNYQLQSLKLPDSKKINVHISGTPIEKSKEQTVRLIIYICLGLLLVFFGVLKRKYTKNTTWFRLIFPNNPFDKLLNIITISLSILLIYIGNSVLYDTNTAGGSITSEEFIYAFVLLAGIPLLVLLLIIKLTIFLIRKSKRKSDKLIL